VALGLLSRSTVNPSTCQRWTRRRQSLRPAGELIDTARYRVEVIDRTTGAAFVKAHHYSGSYVASRLQAGLFHKGATSAERLVGACAFSVPMNGATVRRWLGIEPAEGLELGRLVLLDEVPGNGESWFVARAFAQLAAKLPSVTAVVSFADPMPRRTASGEVLKPGHIGTVYQALGARYAGRSNARWLLMDREARVVSARSLSKLRSGERGAEAMERRLRGMGAPRRRTGESGRDYVDRAKAAGLRDGWLSRVKHNGNHAYLFPVLPAARLARKRARKATVGRWPEALAYPRIADTAESQQVMF